MKRIFFITTLAAYLFAGCGGENKDDHGHEHGPGTHEHHDSSDHRQDDTSGYKQEEFRADTGSGEKHHDHSHGDGGHNHKH